MPKLIGKPLPRREDRRLITGAGRYTADIRVEDAAYAYFVRSPHAHARIVSIDAAAALAAPGVLAVLTGADYVADGYGPMSHIANSADAIDPKVPAFIAPPGTRAVPEKLQLPIPFDVVRFVGEPVAFVVAESAAQARDAAELVAVEYEPLPAVVSAEAALAADAPQLWEDLPGNLCFDLRFGDEAAVERAFAGAHLVVEREFHNQRLYSAHMEPRAAVGDYDAEKEVWTLIAGGQGAHRWRAVVAAAMHAPPDRVVVVTPDTGGAFGSRNHMHPEPMAVLWAAKRVGRPVRWNGDRSEGFLTDYSARDITVRAAMAFDAGGKIVATRFLVTGNVGAHPASYAPLQNYRRLNNTVYDVQTSLMRVRAVVTNTTPVVPFRGAGRPEATATMERLLDLGAAGLGLDRIEIRRRNLIAHDQLPYRNAGDLVFDAGDFVGNMERALAAADWTGFPARRADSEARGRLRGIGVANYVETPVGTPREKALVRVYAERSVEVLVGTQSSGQGHETTFAQVVAELLGVPFETVSLIEGDTRLLDVGGGSHSNRSMRLGGTLLVRCCEQILAQARAAAATELGCEAPQLDYGEGTFVAPDGRRRDLFELARAHELSATADFFGRIPAYPTGCGISEIELDPATGAVAVVRYTQVDDAGQPINPLILHGQAHGGIAQGIGQALYEGMTIEPDYGQVLSGSFMDYAVPRASQLPQLSVELTEDPTAGNPLRVKGGGEGGITPSPVATVNAILDALRPYGVDEIPTPATPERIWRLIHPGAESAA